MAVPTTTTEFLSLLRKSGVADVPRVEAFLSKAHDTPLPTIPAALADRLTQEGLLTNFQARQLLKGKWKMILSGKYTCLEPLGAGGMGTVYLCSHKIMNRFVALKVLPAEQAADPSGLERFHREARAIAQLRHPNIAVAYDVDHDGPFHFLVMEYIEGSSFEQLVRTSGQIDPTRAAHYVHQAALGLQHAHEAGLVHRDVKPANILVDREGVVRVLDLGLARFFNDNTDPLTKRYEAGTVLGTADYLAPEQAIDSHNASPRADIYSLGLTFYFLLAGRSAVQDGSVVQKLLWHQMRESKPLSEVRPDVPAGIAAVITKMTAKDPDHRYQTMAEVAEALAAWTQTPIAPPTEEEMPHAVADLRRAGLAVGSPSSSRSSRSHSRVPVPAKSRASRPGPGESGSSIRTAPDTIINKAAATIAGHSGTEDTQRTPVPTPPEPQGSPAVVPAHRRKTKTWLLAGGASAALLVVIGAALALLLPSSKPTDTSLAAPVAPAGTNPSQTQTAAATAAGQPVAQVAPRSESPVSIKSGVDGLHVRAPNYEAVIDKTDGCLSSFRVGGVEFFKCGAPLAGGKTSARGGYFYSDKDGHQGLVKMPDLKQPAPNVVVATGDKFSVRYEFGADALTVTAQNSTDDTVPYYLVFDSLTVHEVANEKGETLSVPFTMAQGEPLDPKWRTTTWAAGRARLKVSDRTDGATTRLWGPFSEYASQIWEGDAKTYNHCQFTLEASLAPETAKPVLAPGGVLITRDGPTRRIRTEFYESSVEADGCLPSLRIDGVEVLRANLDVSRGAYYLMGRTQQLSDIKQPSPNTLLAQNENVSIRYEFAHNKMTWTLENKMPKQGLPFFVVMDASVTAVCNDKGEWAKAPVVSTPDPKWATTTWYAGRAKLKMTGGSKVWGPWQDKYQVWEASMAPLEKRVVTVEIGLTDAAEAAKIGEVTGQKPTLATDLTLDSPTDYQVFQRRTKLQGAVTVSGRVRTAYDRLEMRALGVSLQGAMPDQWREIPLKGTAGSFDAVVPTAAGGWYKVEVRALKDGKIVGQMKVDHVGVGEVFVGAGQSNSTNCGQERIQQVSGMVSSFSGTNWQLGDDPQPGVHDTSAGGSYWPAFGDELYAKYHVPIGVASTGHSGTSVNQWAPGGELFRWTTWRMSQLGRDGFRGVLWHQGESDVAMPAEEYTRKMTALIQDSRKSAGWEVPWFVAHVSYHNPGQPSFAGPRAGQKNLWDTGTALEGPDTDTLAGDNRDDGGKGIHFSPKGLRAHGKMWADKVGVYLDKELAK